MRNIWVEVAAAIVTVLLAALVGLVMLRFVPQTNVLRMFAVMMAVMLTRRPVTRFFLRKWGSKCANS